MAAWPMLKKIFSDWNEHEAPRLGAALAFYTVLSLSPLLLLLMAAIGLFFDRSSALKQVMSQVEGLLGANGAMAVRATLDAAQKNGAGSASIWSILILLIGASGVFGELRSALNTIFDVKAEKRSGLWGMVRERFFSFGMVMAVGFLLLASLIFSAGLAAFMTFFGGLLPLPHFVASALDFVFSTFAIGAVFALMFRYVPEVKIQGRAVWLGGMLTGFLFSVGKYLIGLYLAKAGVGSSYGAAGSIVVVIVWVYYTAQIVFLGAEFTHVYAAGERAAATQPLDSAVPGTAVIPVPRASEAIEEKGKPGQRAAAGFPLLGAIVLLVHTSAAVFFGAGRRGTRTGPERRRTREEAA